MILFDDARFDAHHQGWGHPESPERLVAVRAALADQPWQRRPARRASRQELLAVHHAAHVDLVLQTEGRSVVLDPDLRTSPGTVDAALRACGAALDAADQLLAGTPSFVLARPPGHHATPDRSMGFCVFNQAALAADRLSGRGGAGPRRRVLVFDPDVHHGNGTQEIFWQRGDVLYLSIHRAPFYPGSGSADERGAGEGEGATVNLPLPVGAGDVEYLALLRQRVLPEVERFAPDCCVLSAGYDALELDPLGGMKLSVEGMVQLWSPIVQSLPTLAVLEGGYSLEGLAQGVAATAPLLADRPVLALD